MDQDKMEKEQKLIERMTAILEQKMVRDYAGGIIKRDAHPKDLGLVKAVFSIAENLPDDVAKGIFSAPKKYNCLIRLSNSSGRIKSDKEKDFRGFAIKLLDVQGERVDTAEKHTQDFILMSNPTMPFGTVKLFHDAVYYSIKWHPLLFVARLILTGNKKVLTEIKKGKANHTSSFDIRYWSTTPYQLEDSLIKYTIIPTSEHMSTFPVEPDDDYLLANNAAHLREHEASFDFLIQFFKNEKDTPLENAGIEWKELHSPFIKIATITIPKQDILTEQRKDLAEVLAFSPANSLLAHQPFGGLNKARMHIYKRLAFFRNRMNEEYPLEPDCETYDTIR
ncbi:hypothetical protein DU508_12185 [Pedobacter chinensis]|uniref:Catalase n=1 Tax=Pedobacter chinensis TaxID=2282421 RepID=A0A369Q024_9SPHI|nr:hypothetical protein [Pedobacter chinensis]RDC56356.1 hypothetical protein DU508_12185 [Pedobacter chinensis]